jgi:hypothetical protein
VQVTEQNKGLRLAQKNRSPQRCWQGNGIGMISIKQARNCNLGTLTVISTTAESPQHFRWFGGNHKGAVSQISKSSSRIMKEGST